MIEAIRISFWTYAQGDRASQEIFGRLMNMIPVNAEIRYQVDVYKPHQGKILRARLETRSDDTCR